MKQILCRILLLTVVIAAILGLSSCKIFVEPEASLYDLEVNKFERSIVYGSELDLSGLKIKVTTGTEIEYIPVTEDMVTGNDTDTVGEKELVVKFADSSWSLYYEVFYKVEHIVDGFVYDSQLVMSRDELMIVDDPVKNGYTFIGWDIKIPDELTGNLRIEAMFADVVLPKFSATYGDTLADIALPEAEEGHWEWKDDPATKVGNAGTNRFTIVYVPNNPAAEKLEFEVPVSVAKRRVEITIIQDTFEYDGNEHAIQYKIPDDLTETEINLVTFGTKYASASGSYYYQLYVAGKNYEGEVEGMLTITPRVLNVSVLLQDPADMEYKSSVSIDYGEAFPEYRVDVVDKDGNPVDISALKLGVVVNKPDMLAALGYEISATIVDNNDNGLNNLGNYKIVYNSARFEVNKVDFNPGEPVFTDNHTVYYGDALSSVKFADHPNGEWAWDYEYSGGDTVGNVGKNTFKAIFTPGDTNYNSYVAYVTIDVQKQVLYFEATTTVSYTGEEQGLTYVIKDKEGNEIKGLTVTGGDTKYIDAGTYPYTLNIVDPNYTHSADNRFDFTIEKIDPAVDVETPRNIVWVPGLTLGDISLPKITVPGSIEWLNPETPINAAGTYTFRARYTPTDTKNYNVIERDLTVIVSLAESDISFKESFNAEWTYDGSPRSLADLSKDISVTGTMPDQITARDVVYYLNGEEITTLTNAGGYNITVVAPATTQYAEARAEVLVTIKRAEVEITNLDINGWTYGEAANAPASDVNYGEVIYEYRLMDADDSEYTTVVPTLAGEYVLRARVESSDNWYVPYGTSENPYPTKDFTIAKAKVTLPTIASQSYTGSHLVADVADSELYRVEKNDGGIGAGNYEVVLVLNDPANYAWINGAATAETTAAFVITKAENEIFGITPVGDGNWVYGDTVSYTVDGASFGIKTVTINYYIDLGDGVKDENEVDVVINAGNYIVRAKIEGNANYDGAYYEYAFKVAKLEIEAPVLAETEYEYTGNKASLVYEKPLLDTKYYSVTNNGDVVVNTEENPTYSVEFELKSNYRWKGEDESITTKTLTYSVIPTAIKIESLEISDWTYGENSSNPSATKDKEFGNIVYEYKPKGADDSEYTIIVPTAAGEYVLRARISDTNENGEKIINYYGDYGVDYKPVEFTIHKAKDIFSIETKDNLVKNDDGTYTLTLTYTGSEFDLSGCIIANTVGGSAVTYSISKMKDVADSGKVTISAEGSANYVAADPIVVNVVINKADASISINTNDNLVKNDDGTYTLTLTYNGSTFDLVSLIGAEREGEAAVAYSISEMQNVADSGEVVVSVADSDNYNGTSVKVNVVINPADITNATVTLGEALTYNGAEQTQTVASVMLGKLAVDNYTVTGNTATNAGTYTLTIEGQGNFKGTKTVEFTVERRSISDAEVTLGEALTYNGKEQTKAVISVTIGDLDVTRKITGNTATNAGTYTLTVEGTGNFTGTKTVEYSIAKANASISINTTDNLVKNDDGTYTLTLTYNGSKFDLVSLIGAERVGEAAVAYSISEMQNVADSGEVVVSVADSANYNGTSVKVNVVINPADITNATVELGEALTYNGAEQTQEITSVTLGKLAVDNYTVTGNTATNAGTYTLTIEGTGNFTGIKTVDFTIARFELDKPEIDHVQWTGEALNAGITSINGIKPEDGVYTLVDEGGIDEGDYTATITIINPNYKWKGIDDAKVEVKYSIAKQINSWVEQPSILKDTWTYGDDATIINLGTPANGEVTYKFAPEGTEDYQEDMPTKPGKYVIVFTATAEGFKNLSKTISFEIKKDTLTIPEFVDDTLDYANGAAPELVLVDNPDNSKFFFTNNVKSTVGDYEIVFTIKEEFVDYYKWENTDSTEIRVHYSIVRADEKITDLVIEGWTYGDAPNAPTANKKFTDSEIIYEYKQKGADDSLYITEVPTAAGDYVLRARINGGEGYNWNGASATFEFTIERRSISDADVTLGDKLTYNGAEQTQEIDSVTIGDLTVTYNLTGNTATNAGTYALTIEGTGNFKGTKDVEFTVERRSISDATVTLGDKLTYNGAEQTQAVDSVTLGKLTVDTYTVTGNTVTNAGTYTLTVEGTGNFTGTKTVEYSIAKANASISIETKDNLVKNDDGTYTLTLAYNGSKFDLASLIGAERVGEAAVAYSISEMQNVADSGDVVVSVADSDNYNGASVTVEVVITPVDITNATVELGEALTYNGAEQTQEITSVTLGDFTVTYTVTGNTKKNAGTYTLTITGTGNFTGTKKVEWSIAKLYLDKPDQGTASYVYTGEEITFFDKTNGFWTANGSLAGTDVNSEATPYKVTISIASAHIGNCLWSDETATSIVYSYSITKGQNELYGTLTIDGWIYGEAVNDPTGITGAKWGWNPDNVKYQYCNVTIGGDWTDAAPTSASPVGTYKVRAYLEATDNYDRVYSNEVEFVISPVEVDIPEINETQIYVMGADNYPTLLDGTVLTEGDYGYYTVTYSFSGTLIPGVTYKVTVSLNDKDGNYVWSGTNDWSDKTLSYKLEAQKATISVENTDGVVDGWIYGNAPEDYESVIKAITSVYVKTPGDLDSFSMTLKYFATNDANAIGSTKMPTDAGTYYFKIVVAAGVAADVAYEETTSGFYQFTIEKATPDYTVPEGLTAVYGSTLASVELPYGWTWNNSETVVGDVGADNKYYATYDPNNSNYNTVTVEVPVTVTQKTVTLSDTNKLESKPYIEGGYDVGDIFAFQFKAGQQIVSLTLGTDYTVTITNENGNVVDSFNAIDNYTVTVTLTNNNYALSKDSKTEYSFSVTKALLTVDGAVENNTTAPYGGDLHGKTAADFNTGLTLKDASGNEVTGLTIKVIIYTNANDPEGSMVESITDAGIYYVRYYLESESDTHTMNPDVRIVTVSKAKVDMTTLPAFTGEYFMNQFNLGYYSITTEGVVTVVEGQFSGTVVAGSWSYSASFNSADPTKSTLICTFTMTDEFYKNYQFVSDSEENLKTGVNTSGTVNLLTVAVAGDSMTSGTKYGSLEAALSATTSGTVWLMSYDDKFVYPNVITADNYSNAIVLMSNATVHSGVTLVLPYNVNGGRNSDGVATVNYNYSSAIKNPATNRKTLLIIANGVQLTVEGTLEVNGIMSAGGSGGDYSGQTCSEYAEIILDGDNAKITGKGTIKCSGYITGNGTVDMIGGSLYVPFILRDFGGGSYMTSIKSNGMSNRCSPFTEWMFENVQSTLIINSGVTVNVWANLTASDEIYSATGQMIGDGSFIYLPAGSKLITHYNPATEVLSVDIYGGATFNPFSLTILGEDISTEDVYFPLNWAQDIRLHGDGALYNASKVRFQLMYGNKLTVEEGATLKIMELMVHEDYKAYLDALNEPSLDPGTTILGVTVGAESRVLAYARTILTYKDAKYQLNDAALSHPRIQDAKLVINGSLEADSFGGKIYSESKNASVKITSTVSCSVNLPVKFTLSSALSSVSGFQTITRQPTLYGYNVVDYVLGEDGQLVEWDGEYDLVYNEKTKKYEYQKPETLVYARFSDGTITDELESGILISTVDTFVNVGKKWTYPTVTVQYDTQGGNTIGDTTHNHIGDGVFNGAIASGTSKSGYVFAGWYLDQAFTKPLSDYLVDGQLYCPDSDTVVLYAGWTYKIDYEYIDPDGNVITQSDWAEGEDAVMSGGSTAGTVTLFNPTHETYQFLGWFADAAGTIKVGTGGETISESVISQYMENNTVKLYGIWKGTVYTFTVNDVDKYGYGYTNNGFGGGQHTFTPSDIDGAKFPVPANTNRDVDSQYYFTGWSVSVNGGDAVIVTDITYFADLIPDLGESVNITVTAQWAQKVTITVTVGKATDSNSTSDTNANYTATFSDESGTMETKSYNKAAEATNIYYLIPGQKFVFSVTSGSGSNLPTATQTAEAGKSYNYTINWIDGTKSSSSCITGDTLITLADGTQKRVDQLTGDELLLVWNLETGRYEAANIVFIDSEAEAVCEIIHLYFSDGSEVKVISEHGFFDLDLAKYVYIDATNYSDYIGHRFVTEGDINSNTWNEVTLTNVVIEHKLEKAWSPVTFKQLCYYTNGVLSMPGGIDGLFNIFEVDTDTMTYDAEKMQADIETYGLLTLDDFGGMIPEVAFEAFNGAWLNVAIGKGMLTWEDIEYLAERYVPLV